MTLLGLTGGAPGNLVALEIGAAARTAVVRARTDLDLNDSGAIEDIFTITRASGGSSFEAGAWTWVSDNVPRYDASGRLLCEPQSTNLWLYSDDVTNSNWQKSGTTAPAPHQIRETTANAGHYCRQRQALPNGNYAWGVDLKGVGRSQVTLQFETSGNFNNRSVAVVDLDTGSVVSITNFGTFSGTVVDISDVDADGYRRYIVTGATGSKGGDGTVWAAVSLGTYVGDTNKGFDIRRTQVEQRSSPTSYIPTTTATVTRAADSILKPVAEFPWNSGAGRLMIDGTEVSPIVNDDMLDVSAIAAAEGKLSIGSLQWISSP